jgi:hypothetical protein
MAIEIDGPEGEFVISNPIPAKIPLKCRSENGPVFQGHQPPSCDGILRVEMFALHRMLKMDDLPTVQCPKCRLAHGFLLRYGTLFYGALL